MTEPSSLVVIDLARWVGPTGPEADRLDAARLELRDSGLDEAIGETAVRLARLARLGPHLVLAPSPALLELVAEEQRVTEGLHQRAVLAGAGSAFAAADAAFLPSLADFLR